MKRSDFANFNELRRLQKREHERTVEDYPIFTDRTTMERKETKKQVLNLMTLM